MEKAKAAVSDFLSKSGHHDTTVHEHVAPAVTQETINRTRHEEEQTVVDREVHQHHHHTTIQPVNDREVLPEKHSHHMGGVEHREHHHGNDEAIRRRLEEEAAQFKNIRTEGGVRETHSVAPVVGGEHMHHHVHETIQPIIQKEVIQPSVVHTTVPVHEVHHNEARHHAASALPAVSMAEFKNGGGVLNGREERVDRFDGEPKGISNHLGNNSKSVGSGTKVNQTDARVANDIDGNRNTDGIDGNRNMDGMNNSTTTIGKPSLLDRLNPIKNTNHDGKREVIV